MYSFSQTIGGSIKFCKHEYQGRTLGNPLDAALWCSTAPSNPCLLVRVMQVSVKSHTKIKVFQRLCLFPVCENHYSVTWRGEIILTWLVLHCYLSYCYFLGAYTLTIFFGLFLRRMPALHLYYFLEYLSILHELSVTTANALEVV